MPKDNLLATAPGAFQSLAQAADKLIRSKQPDLVLTDQDIQAYQDSQAEKKTGIKRLFEVLNNAIDWALDNWQVSIVGALALLLISRR